MTDHTLARADEVLTELVELVETARTLPMSSSCVLPRERTLDLLDALREVLPPEVLESRRIVAQRDALLGDAEQRARETVEEATARAEALVSAARAEAHTLLEDARAEQGRLVSSATVHQVATSEAARVTADAEQSSELARQAAEGYAERLRADAHGYAERTLADLVDTLQRLTATAENGRSALARPQRTAGGEPLTQRTAGGEPAGADTNGADAPEPAGAPEPPLPPDFTPPTGLG